MDRHVLTLDEATCRRRTSIKWQHHDPDVLPLWIAEMDVLPAPAVAEELQRVARDGDLGYPVPQHYLDAVARWYGQWDPTVDPSRMALATDAMSGVRGAVTALSDPGDPVYITVPVYPPFHSVAAATGRRMVTVPLDDDGRYDVAALDEAFTAAPGRGVLLLANPHNPTGVVPTADELRAVAEVADRHGVRVVSAEVHAPLVLPGASFTPALAVPEAQGWLSVISAAKGWNLAAVKAAGIAAGTAADDLLAALPEDLGYTTSHLAVRLHTVALEQDRSWLVDLVTDLDANRTLLAQLLERHLPSVHWRPVEATYLAWLDLRELDLGDDPAVRLRQDARVALMSGPPFGAGEGHARLNFATSPQILEEVILRIAASLQ